MKKSRILLLALIVAALFCFSGCFPQQPTTLDLDTVYSLAQQSGYTGTVEDFVAEFKGADGANGKDGENGEDGKDGVGIYSAGFDENNHLILILTNGERVDCGELAVYVENEIGISIGTNGNWVICGEDTGVVARGTHGTQWITGIGAPSVILGRAGDVYFDEATCDLYKKSEDGWTLFANIKGDAGEGTTIYEGNDYNVNIGAPEATEKYAAAIGLLSSVRIEASFNINNQAFVSRGSGVIYKLDKSTGDAYIITNYHVVYEKTAQTYDKISNNIALYLYGYEYTDYAIPAEYVGGSMNYDIAVLKVTDSELMRKSIATPAEFADSSLVNVLDTAIAIGNANGDGISVTKGTVSIDSTELTMTGPDGLTSLSFRVMQIDTAVNGGNSGGGLFDGAGKLIGIVNAKKVDTAIDNMAYAIPANVAKYVADNIISNCDGADNRRVIKLTLGVTVTLSEVTTVYDPETAVIKKLQSAVVSDVVIGALAEGSLEVGDVIVSMEHNGITYENAHIYDLGESLLNVNIGDTFYINILRDDQPLRIELVADSSHFTLVK